MLHLIQAHTDDPIANPEFIGIQGPTEVREHPTTHSSFVLLLTKVYEDGDSHCGVGDGGPKEDSTPP